MKKIMPTYYLDRGENIWISNRLGGFLQLSRPEFDELVEKKTAQVNNPEYSVYFSDPCYEEKLEKNFFIVDVDKKIEYSAEYRKKNVGLFHSANLHIFVLTLDCNLACRYCQAECNVSSATMMSRMVAKSAVDILLKSPENSITIEFQGGEPLLNFPVLKFIVEYVNENKGNKKIDFSLVNNGQAMDEEKLNFLVSNNVAICFSIDGSKAIHDYNRPSKDGTSNFDKVFRWYHKAKDLYLQKGKKSRITALPTITRYSLNHYKDIIDFYYYNLKERSISIRPLSPFGRARKNWQEISYSAEEFISFYIKSMNYLREISRASKRQIREGFSKIILDKLEGKIVNYPDLRSPCGAGTGQIAYNWNGNIYTCDEGRMMSNKGIETFCIGTINSSYEDMIASDVMQKVCVASCLESHPYCRNCIYHPICGICPVYNLQQQGSLDGNPVVMDRCKILQGTMEYLLKWKFSGNSQDVQDYHRWINE